MHVTHQKSDPEEVKKKHTSFRTINKQIPNDKKNTQNGKIKGIWHRKQQKTKTKIANNFGNDSKNVRIFENPVNPLYYNGFQQKNCGCLKNLRFFLK